MKVGVGGGQEGGGVDSVYLDFSKAFDKVETGVLLHKLVAFKITGKVGCWLAAFLDSNSRKQAVVVDGNIACARAMPKPNLLSSAFPIDGAHLLAKEMPLIAVGSAGSKSTSPPNPPPPPLPPLPLL